MCTQHTLSTNKREGCGSKYTYSEVHGWVVASGHAHTVIEDQQLIKDINRYRIVQVSKRSFGFSVYRLQYPWGYVS